MTKLIEYNYLANSVNSKHSVMFVLFTLFVSLIIIPGAYAETVKVVVTFEFDGNINQIQGIYNSNFEPARQGWFDKFGENFTGFSWDRIPMSEAIVDMGINPDTGNHQYQIYPKQWYGGETNMDKEEYNFAHDILVGQTRQELINFLSETDAYNVETHLHYSWGSIDLIETF